MAEVKEKKTVKKTSTKEVAEAAREGGLEF